MKYVYLAKAGRFVKIGCSSSPIGRVIGIMNNSEGRPTLSRRLVLLHATPGDNIAESELHATLDRYRIMGEWYSSDCLSSPEITQFLSTPKDLGPADYGVDVKVRAGEYVTPGEAATLLCVTKRTIYTWCRSGQLEALKFGNSWRIVRAGLRESQA